MISIKAKTKQEQIIKAATDLTAGRLKSVSPMHNFYASLALILLDLTAVAISLAVAYLIRHDLLVILLPSLFSEKLLSQTFVLLWWYPLVFIFCLAYENLYQRRLPFWIEVEWVFKAGTLTLFLSVVLLYLVQIGEDVSRSYVLLTWAISMIIIPTMRFYGKKQLIKLSIWNRPVLLIGNGYTIPMIHGALKREQTMGYTVVGYLANRGKNPGIALGEDEKFLQDQALPFLGSLDQIESVIVKTGIEDIIIAEPSLSSDKLVELTNKLQPLVNNIILVPDLFGVSLSGIEAAYFFEEQAVLLHIKNRLKSKLNRLIKRTFDLIAGTLLSVPCFPLILIIGLAVKLDSPGPAFHISDRIGRGGRIFRCYKFRTMYQNADELLTDFLESDDQARYEWEHYNKLISEDPRITRLGRLLRRFSIDELPQLINVICGQMSLVGPRPYLPREEKQMGSWIFDILVGKPGLTGLWQVSGRNKLTFENRLRLDTWYMKNWSLWLDAVLLLKTLRVIMKSDGAY
jgi:Undecaprenyl-phosphate galactose phosphotransferase WbaP